MIKIAVCDDNKDELSNMAQLIDQYRASKHFNCEYELFLNGLELAYVLEKGRRFDIYCLDILMPGFSGIDLAKEIRTIDKNASILFLTSSPEFALESYSVKASNYLIKPISKEKLFTTFDDIIEDLRIKDNEDSIIVKSNEGIEKILTSNLVFAEVIGRNVHYHTLSGKVITCRESFSAVYHNLMKYGCFLKTHRSYIVNMQYIDNIKNNQVSLQTLATVPIAQGKTRELKQQYLSYQMNGA